MDKLNNELEKPPIDIEGLLNKIRNRGIMLLILAILVFATNAYVRKHIHISNTNEVNETMSVKASDEKVLYSGEYAVKAKNIESDQEVNVLQYLDFTVLGETERYAEIELNGENYYLPLSQLYIPNANAINAYIEEIGFPYVEMTEEFYSAFNQYEYTNGKPEGIVIHDTGNENTTIEGEINHMKNNYSVTGDFVHTFIDNESIIRIADESLDSAGAGETANLRFIQFEMPHVYDKDEFARQLANAAYYTAYMFNKFDIEISLGQEDGTGTIWTHEMVSIYFGDTDHIDPVEYWERSAKEYFNTTYTVEDFIQLVEAYHRILFA